MLGLDAPISEPAMEGRLSDRAMEGRLVVYQRSANKGHAPSSQANQLVRAICHVRGLFAAPSRTIKDLAPATVCGMKDCREYPSLDTRLCLPVVLIAPVNGKWRIIGSKFGV